MIAFNLTEWVVVGLVLLFGWLLGLMSSSGGKKWKERLEEERTAHAATRTTHAEALKAEQLRYRELETRHTELERTRAVPVAPVAAGAAAAGVGTAAVAKPGIMDRMLGRDPVADRDGAVGDDARRDDLGLIHGIGRQGEARLREEGITGYRDIEALSRSDETALERRIGLDDGTIERERWREQAAMLREGRHDDHRRQFS